MGNINMAEEAEVFDPSLKKKKKKKKTFDLDAAMETQADNTGENEAGDDGKEDAEKEEDDVDLESFGKKKKKKKTFDMDDLEEALPDEDGEDDLNLDTFGKKKKKKKKDRLGDADGDDADDGENKENESSDPWAQSDRDYTYDELLQRVFGIMRDKNPEMVAGEKKKFVMRPPQVVRVGTKKTAFVNF